ncbi:MAG: NADH-quinone oxidoreductase subunit A [Verrucomicrobiota bacterium]
MLGFLAVAFSFGMLILSVILGKKGRRSRIKDTAYECGMLPVGEGSTRLSVKFYLVAMLFILFDIEGVFLYPWAVIYRDMLHENPNVIFGSMISFLAVLFVGYTYALKKRAFDWKS